MIDTIEPEGSPRRRRFAAWIWFALFSLAVVLVVAVIATSTGVFTASSTTTDHHGASHTASPKPSASALASPDASPGPDASPTPMPSVTVAPGIVVRKKTTTPTTSATPTVSASPTPQPTFGLSGSVSATLSPGVGSPLNVSISNPNSTNATLASLSLSITSVTAPNATASLPCTTNDYYVTQMGTGYTVTLLANSATSLSSAGMPSSSWPQIAMQNSASNQDGCKGATVNFTYAATATGASS